MKVLNTYFLTAIAIGHLGSGCIPVLRTQVVHYGVEGKLVDADSGAPIAKQHIQVTVDAREQIKKTDRQGGFKIGPDRRHYWAWLMGGPFRPAPTMTSILIRSSGYLPYNRDVASGWWATNAPEKYRKHVGYLGIIELQKSQPGSERTAGQPMLDKSTGSLPTIRPPS